jgi:hypothetical protein
MMEKMFGGPIPGESLTREPGNAPWEQPPRMDKIEHVAAFYLDKLEDDEKLEDLLALLEQGMPVDQLVSSMLLYGEMEGEHSTDTSMLIAPFLHEYVVFLAKSADVDYVEFQGEESDPNSKLIDDFNATFDPTQEPEEEMIPEEIELPEEVEIKPTPSKGLIPRRQ